MGFIVVVAVVVGGTRLTYQVPRWLFFHQYFFSVWDLYFLLTICLLTHNFFRGWVFLLSCIPFCFLSFTIFFNAADLRAKAVLVSFSVLYEEIFCPFVDLRRHYRSSQPFFGATEGATAIYSRGWAREKKISSSLRRRRGPF